LKKKKSRAETRLKKRKLDENISGRNGKKGGNPTRPFCQRMCLEIVATFHEKKKKQVAKEREKKTDQANNKNKKDHRVSAPARNRIQSRTNETPIRRSLLRRTRRKARLKLRWEKNELVPRVSSN